MDKDHGQDERLILVTGATGYIGGRLLQAFEQQGRRIRCLVRRPEYLQGRVGPRTSLIKGDAFERDSLMRALNGVHTAYYLIHALAGRGSFEENDRMAAQQFAGAARESGVRRIIYLGGLGRGDELSHHLASRQEVGAILRDSGITTIEFRASIVIGSGSLSFEMVRALVQRLPVMTTPRWVRSLAQPIAIEDVIAYLTGALDVAVETSAVFEIGGADRVSYEGIMREYARIRGLRRLIIPVALLSPGLSSLWLALVTPLYFRVGRRLIEGVRNETTVHDNTALKVFSIRPRGIREAIRRALVNEDREFAMTRWSDALPVRSLEHHFGGVRFGSRLIDTRETVLACSPEDAFRQIHCVGGPHGWYTYDWLWSLRGFIDQLLGGVGHRRGRPSPRCLRQGDHVDFWRVEALESGKMLRLFAEMKMPGRAWLQFEVRPAPGGAALRQTALFDPVGIAGLMYWYGLYPLHMIIFRGMLAGLARAAENGASGARP